MKTKIKRNMKKYSRKLNNKKIKCSRKILRGCSLLKNRFIILPVNNIK